MAVFGGIGSSSADLFHFLIEHHTIMQNLTAVIFFMAEILRVLGLVTKIGKSDPPLLKLLIYVIVFFLISG